MRVLENCTMLVFENYIRNQMRFPLFLKEQQTNWKHDVWTAWHSTGTAPYIGRILTFCPVVAGWLENVASDLSFGVLFSQAYKTCSEFSWRAKQINPFLSSQIYSSSMQMTLLPCGWSMEAWAIFPTHTCIHAPQRHSILAQLCLLYLVCHQTRKMV